MKIANMVFTGLLVFMLLLLPFQAVQARGLADGPIFGSNYTLKSGESLSQDLVVFGGSVSIEKDATVNGAVVLFGGSLTLDGEVSKDVVVMGGAVKLGPETHIHGNLVTFGSPVNRDRTARVDGDVVNNLTSPTSPAIPVAPGNIFPQTSINPINPILNAFGVLGQSVILALLAILITMFLPTHLRRVSESVTTQPFLAFGIGVLTIILFIVAVVALGLFSLFIITVILTIPLIFILLVVFSAACILGWLAMGMEVGVRMAQMFRSEWPLPLSAGLGVFILNLVAQSIGFIPCIGWLLPSILGLAGLGAVTMTRFGSRNPAILPVTEPVTPVQNS